MPPRPARSLALLLLIVGGCQAPTSGPPPATTVNSMADVVRGIPAVEEATAASGARPARRLGEAGEYADGVRMTVGGLDRGYRLSGRPGVPAIAVTVQVVNDSVETAGRENTASLRVRLAMSYGPRGRTSDAVPGHRIGPRRLRPGQSVTGRYAFQVPTRTVQGLVFEGQPGDAYAPIRWSA